MSKPYKTVIHNEIDPSWSALLKEDIDATDFFELIQFVTEEYRKYDVYPQRNELFEAFNRTPLNKLKLVIIGQDPYHGPGQAHGLSFSVPDGVKHPPSLRNIFKELKTDLNIDTPVSGNLEKWTDEGVLLLNSILSVRSSLPGSHQKRGWEMFTDAVISKMSDNCNHLVFLLWGKYAQAKSALINENKHLVLKSAHPSPFSAYNGFFGCQHFSKSNAYLTSMGIEPINWELND